MSGDPATIPRDEAPEAVELPRPTVAPMVLALGMALMAAGVATSAAFLAVGAAVVVVGLGIWVSQLAPGRGHAHEPLVEPSRRPRAIEARAEGVHHLHEGMPGYRLRLPTEVHPISAGFRGGIVGGILMPIPALIWGLWSGHGVWYPVNMLAGMVLPGVGRMTTADLEAFRPVLLLVGLVIHAINSVTFGVIYGVLLPTLPALPRPLTWGGLLMPMLWTALSYGLMGPINPILAKGVDWTWFIASQFVFGIVAASAIARARAGDRPRPPLMAGLIGGVAGGLIMPIPALIWGLATGHGPWYPANLLVGMVRPGLGHMTTAELEAFHPGWLAAAVAIHAAMSLGIGAVFGLLAPRLRHIPAALTWGALVIPLIWTAVGHSLMGVVNPLLQRRVDWPWFIASQFVFGVATAVVVHRSEKIYIPPAGRGPEPMEEYVEGTEGEGS